jgi:hypothetical protein
MKEMMIDDDESEMKMKRLKKRRKLCWYWKPKFRIANIFMNQRTSLPTLAFS